VSAGRQRCRRVRSAVHPLPAGQRRIGDTRGQTTPVCSVRIRRILLQTPSDGCFRKAPSLPDSPMSHSVTRSVLIPRHIAHHARTRARDPDSAARHDSASHGPERLRVIHEEILAHAPFGFRLSENLFGESPQRTRTKRFSEPSEKAPFGLGSGAHSRRFAQECPE
jgi:hypothetical protein